jgi:hypothetical protein
MLYRALLIGLALSSQGAVLKKQPVMKLRGGISGVDADQVTTAVLALSTINGGVMALAPKKAGEAYGVASTKWTDFFAQWSGINIVGQCLAAYLALGGTSLAEAIAWGFVPSSIASIQDFLNDRMVGEMGMGDAAKYMPPLVNLVLTLGLFGKLSFLSSDLSLKVACVWMGLNGLAGYFATDAWLDGWGGKGVTAVENSMGKLFASTMLGSTAMIGSNIFLGKSILESVGIMFGVYAATSLDGLYISKSMEAMGVDSSKALFWAVVQLATVAAIFF